VIDHTGIGVADVGRSATFYDVALGALGMRRVMQMPDNAGTDGVATVSIILSSGSIDITHTPSNSIPPLQPKLEPRSMHSEVDPGNRTKR
jgi:catechol 2,3-dioxygenase-like lactoylglutathione lyase family enzyme